MKTIGILGAGKVGIVLAQLALKAGYRVYIAGSGDASKIAMTVQVLAPGAVAVSSQEAIEYADVIILAFPLSKYRHIPRDDFHGKLVIDATNHWWEVDGPRDDFLKPHESSSEAIRDFLGTARVVKAFNHMGYHDLHDETRQKGEAGRKAIAVAGDDERDSASVASIVDALGFEPVYIGALAEGKKLEPGGNIFGVNTDAETLKRLIAE